MSYHKKPVAGYLYVVATQSGTVKYGISKNVKKRVKSHHHTMGNVSPIVFEWISKECGGYIEIEKKLIFKYGGEYVNGVDPKVIADEIEQMVDQWDFNES